MKKTIFSITFFFAFYLSVLVAVDLKITEVYFAGTDERVEISNISSQDFSGDLYISGAKASIVNLPNLFISANSSILFGDNLSNILDTFQVISSGLSLNIIDTKDLNIKLFHSGTQIDVLSITGSFLANLKTQKSSIQKIQSGMNFITTGSNIISGRNMLPGFFGSPGELYSRDEIFTNNQTGSTTFTGTTGTTIFSSELYITEVYFDGYDERIEISNWGDFNFSGDLQIVGASTIPIFIPNIFISTGQSIIVSQQEYFFLDQSVVVVSGAMLTLQDETAITISLIYSGQIIDTFQVHDYFIQQYNDQKTSFEKVKYNSDIITTISSGARNFNIISGYIANPGTTFIVSESVVNVSTGSTNNSGTIINSGIICDDFQKTIRISEIFPGNEVYPEFIEIHAIQDFNDSIFFSGLALKTGFSIDLNLEADTYIIITSDLSPRLAITNSIQNTSFELALTGLEILVNGQSGQVMDKAVVSLSTSGFSLYPSGLGECEQSFDYIERFTPGFNESILSYYPETGPEIIYITTGTTSGGGGGISTCPTLDCSTCSGFIFPTTGLNNTGTTVYSGSTDLSGSQTSGSFLIKILNIDYNPPGSDTNNEKITLQSFLPYDLDLKDLRAHSLNRTTKNRIYGTLLVNQIQVFTGNYRFPNTGNCVNLLSGNSILDHYCYSPFDDTNPTGDDTTGTGQGGTGSGDRQTGRVTDTGRQHIILIENLVYNPDGYDTNRETITIKLLSGSDMSLEDFSLRVDSRTIKLFYSEFNYGSVLLEGNSILLTGNYRFPNTKATCISIIKDEITYNTYCYDPNEVIIETGDIVSEDREKYIIKIKEIIYNPEGPDTNNETITLQMISGHNIDLSNFKLGVETSTRKIYGTLTQGSSQTFKGNYRFPNTKKTCISLFRDNIIFDTLCYDPADEKEDKLEDPTLPTVDYVDFKIKIQDINYNPPGIDKDRETIIINYSVGSGNLDLTDSFYLQRGNTRRSLKNYGIIQLGTTKLFTGNFTFPNSKDTCVELVREDLIFDKYCYEINNETEVNTGVIEDPNKNIFIPNIQIISIFPNPVGKDTGKEFISLFYTNNISDEEIYLEDDYYLIIGSTKKYFKTGTLIQNQEKILYQNFSFPNKATCVELRKDKNLLDKFCYTKPEEGEKFLENNGILESVSTIDLSILNKIKIKKFSDQYCLSYENQKIICKKLPKISSRTSMEKLYSAYISALHGYLADKRPVIYSKTSVRYYKAMFSDAKKILKTNQEFKTIKGENVSIYDFNLRFHKEYEQTSSEYLINSSIKFIFTEKLLKKYYEIKRLFYKKLHDRGNTHIISRD